MGFLWKWLTLRDRLEIKVKQRKKKFTKRHLCLQVQLTRKSSKYKECCKRWRLNHSNILNSLIKREGNLQRLKRMSLKTKNRMRGHKELSVTQLFQEQNPIYDLSFTRKKQIKDLLLDLMIQINYKSRASQWSMILKFPAHFISTATRKKSKVTWWNRKTIWLRSRLTQTLVSW